MTNEPMRRHPRFAHPVVALALVAAAAFGTAACGDDKKDGATTAGDGAAGTEITIKDFKYSPDPLRAKVGDTITVKNDDGTTHTLTADDNRVDTGNLDGGTSGTVKLEEAGTLAYHCKIHDTTMKGSIEVSA